MQNRPVKENIRIIRRQIELINKLYCIQTPSTELCFENIRNALNEIEAEI